MSDTQRWLRDTQRKVQDVWERQMYSVGAPVNRAELARMHRSPGIAAPTASAFWWLPLAAVAGGVALWQLASRLGVRGGRRSGGRWVRDRSLGGKMIFIPDADLPGSSNGGKKVRPLYEDPDDGAAAAAAEAAAAAGGVWAAASSPQPAAKPSVADELPEWWDEPRFLVYTTFSRKEELQRQARLVLRELQDAKLQGLDYPISGLVSLRTLCHEAGGYQVKPSTESGRDAMLRHAVQAAIAAAQAGSYSLLGGDPPAKFICGLAHDLGVPDKRAVEIVHGQVAAECREALVTAEAAYRSGDQGDLLMALYRLAGALNTFPLPRGSAQGEMVGRQVAQTMDLALRKQIFLEFGAVSPPLAALMAELLGFDPDLVMAELARLQAAEAAEQQQEEQQQAASGEGSATGGTA
ncbi:Golgi transport 1 [Chlorella sorokiniana]|uniref:Golgi transport 1 n=1 Tax=Chlorella sorokiniana TaxID=3076 RepID=A0A2P6U1H2_CHLSO|nr:Golgi transport 1 [Chlorella sorokiniana]|eukprot:PRW60155.1 Golgi transport 1 [Chlorella sorokiniana]